MSETEVKKKEKIKRDDLGNVIEGEEETEVKSEEKTD
jgi:hypothetical protein